MSYILDALRRADSERERGGIPGLHAQAMHADAHDRQARPWWGQPWAWVGMGVCGGLLVAGSLVWLFSDAPANPAPLVAGATPPHPGSGQWAPPGSAIPPASPPMAPPVVIPPPQGSQGPSMPGPEGLSPGLQRMPVTPVRPNPTPVPAPAPAAPVYNAPPLEVRKPAAPASGVAEAGQAGNRIHTLNELPDDIRRQLPTLAIGGSSYSEHAASRLLILNGQVFREGDKISADLSLEQIQLKSAVLRFKGYRYSVNY